MTVPGKGLHCMVNGYHVAVGTSKWLKEEAEKNRNQSKSDDNDNDYGRTESLIQDAYQYELEGKTTPFVAINHKVVGCLALKDQIKSSAKRIVRALTNVGIGVYIITGDNKRTAMSVAETLGIPLDNVLAEVLPNNKSSYVKSLQDRVRCV